MEYYCGNLCVSARELIEGGLMTLDVYKNNCKRGRMTVVRRGGNGREALVSVESLPSGLRAEVMEMYPGGDEVRLAGWLMSNYELDQCAVAYFSSPSKCGLELRPEKVREYAVNASVLNCCLKLYNRARTAQKLFGGKYNWDMMADAIVCLKSNLGHTLPCTALRFRKKANEYERLGYGCLLSGKFGNQSARKVNVKVERLILSIACLPEKPFNTSVAEMYNDFVLGALDVWDIETGELMNADDFVDGRGEPLVLSETTVNNVLNKPKNRVLLEKRGLSWSGFMHQEAPHAHRHAPEWSFSKISFDDRDLPRKLSDTKARPKAYYAYDVASQAVVGVAYNRVKNVDLVVEMFRNMFRLIERKGWNCPAEVEVENHLMSQWKESFLKAGVMFPFVRFCAPLNSQEKYAEVLHGAKKKSVEHRNHLGIGRFYGKLRQTRVESVKVSDETNESWKDREYYTWDELIADDLKDIEEWNNGLHPNQKKYPGMTRWDVLEGNMNPNLQPVDRAVLARYIGEHVRTSVRRNSYCRVMYEDWWLSCPEALERLGVNDWKVDAYWLPGEDGSVDDVWIYQDGRFIDKLERVGTYNTSRCEMTAEDERIMTEQMKKISKFGKWVNDRSAAVAKVGCSSEGCSSGSCPSEGFSSERTAAERSSDAAAGGMDAAAGGMDGWDAGFMVGGPPDEERDWCMAGIEDI